MQNRFNRLGVCEIFGLYSLYRGLSVYPEILNYSKMKQGDTVLDSGCAFGGSMIAAGRYQGINLICVDSSPKMIRYAKALRRFFNNRNNVTFLVSSSDSLQIDDGSVNVIVDCFSSLTWGDKELEYWDNRFKTLQEYYRVLRAGGNLMVVPEFLPGIERVVKDAFKIANREERIVRKKTILKVTK